MPRGTADGPPGRRLVLALVLFAGLLLRVVYALPEPDLERFEDEKYAMENVVGIVLQGSLEPVIVYYPSPVFNLPPSGLVAASNALHRLTGREALLAVDGEGGVHPAAVLLCRLLMAVYGTLGLGLIFLVGRRLFSAGVGLLAAAMAAFMPWMIHSAGSFKPDPLLVLTVLLAFYGSLRAAAVRRLGPYLLAGLAITLAASSKLPGGLIAVPLVVATLARWRDRRAWGHLLAAGLASMASFVLLNPYWWAYPQFLAGLRQDYAMRAGWRLMTRPQVPGRVVEFLLDGTVHGPLLGVVALAGLVGLTLRVCRRRTHAAERLGLLMLLVFPPAYVLAYALQTAYFKANNFLPILPFTALAAAWALVTGWHRAGARWPALRTRAVAGGAAAAVALLLASPGLSYVHHSLVPSTEDAVWALLRNRLAPGGGRSVVVEPEARRGSLWERGTRFRVAQIRVERLTDLAIRDLDIADAEIFAEHRLGGTAGAFYRQRIERLEADQVHRFQPDSPRLRGPGLLVLMHRRTLLGVAELALTPCDGATTCFAARLPGDMVPRERFSLELWLPLELATDGPSLWIDGRHVDPIVVGRHPPSFRAATARLFLDQPAGAAVRLTSPHATARSATLRLYRWAGGPRSAPPLSSPDADEPGDDGARPPAADRPSYQKRTQKRLR